MTIKKVHSTIGNWFRILSSCLCQSLYAIKPNVQSELCAALAIRLLIVNYRSRWRGIFKGLSQMSMRERWIFLKTSAPLALEDIYWMSLILAGSISLNSSTFNEKKLLKNVNTVYSCEHRIQNSAYFKKFCSENLNLTFNPTPIHHWRIWRREVKRRGRGTTTPPSGRRSN
jgi:hypothetical protein